MRGKLAKALRKMARAMTDKVGGVEFNGSQPARHPSDSRQRAYNNLKRSNRNGLVQHHDLMAILADAGRNDLVAMFSEAAKK